MYRALAPGIAVEASLEYLIWHIRLPRIVLAVLVGGGLAVSGAAIQGIFRNPLADPSLIGITSGAMVFAVAGLLFAGWLLPVVGGWLGYSLVMILAFAGSLLCTLLVYRLASHRGRTSVFTMLLAGIAITALGGALTGLMTYFSSEEELRDITFWTLGSLSGANWTTVGLIAPVLLFSLLLLISRAEDLDVLQLGEAEANTMGVDVQRMKWLIIVASALAVGACVAVSGVIGFIALVVPHLIRLLYGPAHRRLLWFSALLGGILLLWADAFARTVIAPAELPIGVLTALLGAPFFLGLLLRYKRNLHID